MKVSSDIGTLKKVVVHRPDEGIRNVTPSRAIDLLYEDIVFLKKMQEEHDIFVSVIRGVLGNDVVLDFENILADSLTSGDKEALLNELDLGDLTNLLSLEPLSMARALISGVAPSGDNILDPLPNFIFTRDIAAMVNETLIVCKAAKEARYRESILAKFAFSNHPEFQELNRIEPHLDNRLTTLEGGDVMILNEDWLLIGCSERTSPEGVEEVTRILLEKGAIKNVAKIDIPRVRYCMHLDTIFTQVDHHIYAAFAPLVFDEDALKVEATNISGEKSTFNSFKELILHIDPQADFVLCGNGEYPYDEREQWTDGCNLFTLKPSVAITYDRNVKTEEAFRQKGFRIVKAEELVSGINEGHIVPDYLEKTIITIPSSELSRARGGTHCMTLPISRAETPHQ